MKHVQDLQAIEVHETNETHKQRTIDLSCQRKLQKKEATDIIKKLTYTAVMLNGRDFSDINDKWKQSRFQRQSKKLDKAEQQTMTKTQEEKDKKKREAERITQKEEANRATVTEERVEELKAICQGYWERFPQVAMYLDMYRKGIWEFDALKRRLKHMWEESWELEVREVMLTKSKTELYQVLNNIFCEHHLLPQKLDIMRQFMRDELTFEEAEERIRHIGKEYARKELDKREAAKKTAREANKGSKHRALLESIEAAPPVESKVSFSIRFDDEE
jgi:hypothetical protein